MGSTTEHWNEVFTSRDDAELGWYENDPAQTLKFLQEVPDLDTATVFLPGAGTSVLVDVLLPRCRLLVLNDISDVALEKLRARLGADANVHWLHHDIARPLPKTVPSADVWTDRAVLHFLLEEEQIAGYFDNLRATVKPGGHVLLAEFAPDGAPKCAGLALHRYSAAELAQRIGADFTLVREERYVYINPFGGSRPYTYALFQRNGGE